MATTYFPLLLPAAVLVVPPAATVPADPPMATPTVPPLEPPLPDTPPDALAELPPLPDTPPDADPPPLALPPEEPPEPMLACPPVPSAPPSPAWLPIILPPEPAETLGWLAPPEPGDSCSPSPPPEAPLPVEGPPIIPAVDTAKAPAKAMRFALRIKAENLCRSCSTSSSTNNKESCFRVPIPRPPLNADTFPPDLPPCQPDPADAAGSLTKVPRRFPWRGHPAFTAAMEFWTSRDRAPYCGSNSGKVRPWQAS